MTSAAPDLLRRSRALLVGSLLAGVMATGACSKKAPVAQVPPAPLEVPVVPPRLVGPVVVEEPPVPTVEAPEPAPQRQRPARATAKANGGQEPVVKVEPPPDTAKGPETPNGTPSPSATAAEAAPPPLLRTPDTADDASAAKNVQDTLGRAAGNLEKVNYQTLNPGAKGQYDTARRFIAQAQDALKNRQLVFARYLADKADRLSASLLNR